MKLREKNNLQIRQSFGLPGVGAKSWLIGLAAMGVMIGAVGQIPIFNGYAEVGESENGDTNENTEGGAGVNNRAVDEGDTRTNDEGSESGGAGDGGVNSGTSNAGNEESESVGEGIDGNGEGESGDGNEVVTNGEDNVNGGNGDGDADLGANGVGDSNEEGDDEIENEAIISPDNEQDNIDGADERSDSELILPNDSGVSGDFKNDAGHGGEIIANNPSNGNGGSSNDTSTANTTNTANTSLMAVKNNTTNKTENVEVVMAVESSEEASSDVMSTLKEIIISGESGGGAFMTLDTWVGSIVGSMVTEVEPEMSAVVNTEEQVGAELESFGDLEGLNDVEVSSLTTKANEEKSKIDVRRVVIITAIAVVGCFALGAFVKRRGDKPVMGFLKKSDLDEKASEGAEKYLKIWKNI